MQTRSRRAVTKRLLLERPWWAGGCCWFSQREGFGNILHVHTSPDIITYLMLKLQLKFKSVCLASWNIDVSQATFAPLGLVNVTLGWWFAQVKGRGCTPAAWWINSRGIANVASPKPSRTSDGNTVWKCASSSTFRRIERCRRHKKKNVFTWKVRRD